MRFCSRFSWKTIQSPIAPQYGALCRGSLAGDSRFRVERDSQKCSLWRMGFEIKVEQLEPELPVAHGQRGSDRARTDSGQTSRGSRSGSARATTRSGKDSDCAIAVRVGSQRRTIQKSAIRNSMSRQSLMPVYLLKG